MVKSPTIQSSFIVGRIGYIADLPKYKQTVPYYLLDVEETPEVPTTNIELISKECEIEDIRTQEPPMRLEQNAFQLFNWPYSAIRMGSDFDQVRAYCKEMADLVARELKAEEVFCFDFRFRTSNPDSSFSQTSDGHGQNGSPASEFLAPPVGKAHVGGKSHGLKSILVQIIADRSNFGVDNSDQTQAGGLRRLRLHLTPEEFSKYLDSGLYRVRIVNVWRSFNETTQDMPLAICDPNSVGKGEPIAIEIVEPHRVGENYYLRFNPRHKWFWTSDMQPSEVMVFTTWDSKEPEGERTTNCGYHTAFPHPGPHTTLRTSLEIRTIVVNSLV